MVKLRNVPLPKINSLTSLIPTKRSNSDFQKTWNSQNYSNLIFSRSSWSIDFIAKYRLKTSDFTEITILIPSYFCNSSLAPLRELSARLLFYPIKSSGLPDIEELKKLIAEEKHIDMIIGVHYFGKHFDFSEILEIARLNKIWFVEDCAHLLTPSKNRRIKSDFLMFSPHKFLPIPDGAILSVNENIFSTKLEKEDFSHFYEEYIKNKEDLFRPYIWYCKRILQKLGLGNSREVKNFYKDPVINSSDRFFQPKMSKLAVRMLLKLENLIDDEKVTRMNNAFTWTKLVKNVFPFAEILFKPESSESVYLQGFFFTHDEDLKKALTVFNKFKLPICSWPDLPHEVTSEQDYFKETIQLRNKTIFFHVHSSISQKDIESSFESHLGRKN